jgi:hypothetical protein
MSKMWRFARRVPPGSRTKGWALMEANVLRLVPSADEPEPPEPGDVVLASMTGACLSELNCRLPRVAEDDPLLPVLLDLAGRLLLVSQLLELLGVL